MPSHKENLMNPILNLDNGATALQFVGTNDHGIVLAEWEQEFVVWAWHEVDGVVSCELGNYYKNDFLGYAGASNCFRKRAAHFLGMEIV